jgi:hypothetical protein
MASQLHRSAAGLLGAQALAVAEPLPRLFPDNLLAERMRRMARLSTRLRGPVDGQAPHPTKQRGARPEAEGTGIERATRQEIVTWQCKPQTPCL